MNSQSVVRLDSIRDEHGNLLGSRAPRIRSVPDYATSAGEDAIELAAEAGLILDPWQQDNVIDILGEGEDGLWAAFEACLIVARQNGKGAELEAIELAGLFIFGEKLIIHTAHEFKTASEAYLRVKQLIVDTPMLHKKVRQYHNAHGEEGITLKSGQRLRFLARSKGSGRGFSCDRLIYDEAYELPAANVAASLPTLSARPNPQVIYTSSAPLNGPGSEHLRRLRKRGSHAEGYDWDGLCFLEYSANPKGYDFNDKGRLIGLDLDDRRGWYDANPGLNIRIREPFIAKERATMTDEEFARERLGIADDLEVNAVFSPEAWDELRDPTSILKDPVVFGFDTNPDLSMSSISVAGQRLDKKVHIELIDRRRGLNWLVDRLVGLAEDWEPLALTVDAMSPATAIVSRLRKELTNAGLETEVIVTNTTQYGRACLLMFDLFTEHRLVHLGQDAMTAAAETVTKRDMGEAGLFGWARKDSTDITPFVSGTVAVGTYFNALADEEQEEEVDNKVVVFRRR